MNPAATLILQLEKLLLMEVELHGRPTQRHGDNVNVIDLIISNSNLQGVNVNGKEIELPL